MTKLINGAIAAFGVLSISLGAHGYLSKGSKISLIAGGALGVIALASLFAWTKNPRAGRIISLIVAIIALGNFAPKFIKSGDFYPAGVMMIASLLLAGLLIAGHLQAMAARKSGNGA